MKRRACLAAPALLVEAEPKPSLLPLTEPWDLSLALVVSSLCQKKQLTGHLLSVLCISPERCLRLTLALTDVVLLSQGLTLGSEAKPEGAPGMPSADHL